MGQIIMHAIFLILLAIFSVIVYVYIKKANIKTNKNLVYDLHENVSEMMKELTDNKKVNVTFGNLNFLITFPYTKFIYLISYGISFLIVSIVASGFIISFLFGDKTNTINPYFLLIFCLGVSKVIFDIYIESKVRYISYIELNHKGLNFELLNKKKEIEQSPDIVNYDLSESSIKYKISRKRNTNSSKLYHSITIKSNGKKLNTIS